MSSEPDHSVVELTDQDRFIILASDGVWEFITRWVCSRLTTGLTTERGMPDCAAVLRRMGVLPACLHSAWAGAWVCAGLALCAVPCIIAHRSLGACCACLKCWCACCTLLPARSKEAVEIAAQYDTAEESCRQVCVLGGERACGLCAQLCALYGCTGACCVYAGGRALARGEGRSANCCTAAAQEADHGDLSALQLPMLCSTLRLPHASALCAARR